ncbi:MAG TPA: PLP-dependent aminotransferase family protein [Rhodocyclaceae bacterium]|nr:PLP-dependent aminotransferase family protein [Rhodocyclaceae bacterium]
MTELHAPRLAQRIGRLQPSLVREILVAATRPGMISFAGGLPAADLMPPFPADAIGDAALYQYGATEGEPAWRAAVADWIGTTGLAVAPEQILPLAGSQQGLDLAAKLLIDPGAPMLTEAPTYLAALQVFRLFSAGIATVPLEADGPDLAAFERRLQEHRPRCVYLVPTFQNPAGTCYTMEARRAVAELFDHHGTLLIEDDPYRTVSLDVEHATTPISALLKRAPWIYLGSFSKILWPGWRLGYLAARADLVPRLTALKQACDLHTQRPGQHAVAHWLRSERRNADIERLRAGYRLRRDAMQEALSQHLGDIAQWQVPRGGLFFWVRLTRHRATRALLNSAMARGVAFMPGEAFYPDGAEQTHMRLNYSHSTPEQMQRGLAILAELLRAE